MKTVYVLIVVDVEGALTSNDLAQNVYMMDNQKYLGSGFEGTSELMTSLASGDAIVWTVRSVDPGNPVTLSALNGQAIKEKIVTPVRDPLSQQSLTSLFQPPGGAASGTTYQYDITLLFEGKSMTFDPFLVVA